jgi:hypothetical protein
MMQNMFSAYPIGQLSFCTGTVGCVAVRVLRDTGCTTAGIRNSVVKPEWLTGQTLTCKTFGGTIESFPLAMVDVETPYFTGKLRCCVLDDPCADLIIGNVPGVSDLPPVHSSVSLANVVTRARVVVEKKRQKPLIVANLPDLKVTPDEFIVLQEKESDFQKYRTLAEKGVVIKHGGKNKFVKYEIKDRVLYRVFDNNGDKTTQLLVPTSLRQSVMISAHDAVMAGHPGIRRTLDSLDSILLAHREKRCDALLQNV